MRIRILLVISFLLIIVGVIGLPKLQWSMETKNDYKLAKDLGTIPLNLGEKKILQLDTQEKKLLYLELYDQADGKKVSAEINCVTQLNKASNVALLKKPLVIKKISYKVYSVLLKDPITGKKVKRIMFINPAGDLYISKSLSQKAKETSLKAYFTGGKLCGNFQDKSYLINDGKKLKTEIVKNFSAPISATVLAPSSKKLTKLSITAKKKGNYRFLVGKKVTIKKKDKIQWLFAMQLEIGKTTTELPVPGVTPIVPPTTTPAPTTTRTPSQSPSSTTTPRGSPTSTNTPQISATPPIIGTGLYSEVRHNGNVVFNNKTNIAKNVNVGNLKIGKTFSLNFKNLSKEIITISSISSDIIQSTSNAGLVLSEGRQGNISFNLKNTITGKFASVLNITTRTNDTKNLKKSIIAIPFSGEVINSAAFSISHEGTELRDGGTIVWAPVGYIDSCNYLYDKKISISNIGNKKLTISWTFDGALWSTSSSGYGGYYPYTLAPDKVGSTRFDFYPCREGIKDSIANIKIEVDGEPTLTEVIPVRLIAESIPKPKISITSASMVHADVLNSQVIQPIGFGFKSVGTRSVNLTIKNQGERKINVNALAPSLRLVNFPSSLEPSASANFTAFWDTPNLDLNSSLSISSEVAEHTSLVSTVAIPVLGSKDNLPQISQSLVFIDSNNHEFPINSVINIPVASTMEPDFKSKFQLKNKGIYPITFSITENSVNQDLYLFNPPAKNSIITMEPNAVVSFEVFSNTKVVGVFQLDLKLSANFQTDSFKKYEINQKWQQTVQDSISNKYSLNYDLFYKGITNNKLVLQGQCDSRYELILETYVEPAMKIDCINNTFSYENSDSKFQLNKINTQSLRLYTNHPQFTDSRRTKERVTFNLLRKPDLSDFPNGTSLDQVQSANPKTPAQRTLVLYNTNITSGLELANYYAVKRQVPTDNICGVAMTPGFYASMEEYKGAKKIVLNKCICNLAKKAQPNLNCATTTPSQLQNITLIDNIVFLRGWPARVMFDPEEPSLDAYMSQDLFADSDSGLGVFSVSWGRIDGTSLEKAKTLIDRAIDSETTGITGNILSESVYSENPIKYSLRYGDNLNQTCKDNLENKVVWNPDQCSVGGESTGVVPGAGGSSLAGRIIPNVQMFFGSNPWPNGQDAFNGQWNALLNWRKNSSTCTPLCRDLPTDQEKQNCRKNSVDFFKNINSSCVGAASGLIGHQIRSYTVNHFGFFPNGYQPPYGGSSETITATLIPTSSDLNTTDYRVRFGMSDVVSNPTCTHENGTQFQCGERLPLVMYRSYATPNSPIATNGQVNLKFSVDVKNKNNTGDKLELLVIPYLNDGTELPTHILPIDLGIQRDLSTTILQNSTWTGIASGKSITSVYVQWRSSIENRGYFEIDNFKILNSNDQNLLTPAQTAFSEVNETLTIGSWATTAIERLGATAWWGSSSHYRTGGWAFANHLATFDSIIIGKTLGEAVNKGRGIHSGLFYGDPLYRPASARLDIANTKLRLSYPNKNSSGLTWYAAEALVTPTAAINESFFTVIDGESDPILNQPIQFEAFNGRNNTTWKVELCEDIRGPRYCDLENKWTSVKTGTASVRRLTNLGFTLNNFINNKQQVKFLNFKITVNANNTNLRNYLLLKYQP